ncbi:NAD(P)H-hydrate dehydratase [Rhodoferax sp. AJA081-3]|nr:NAD(P)H-hydrate dehydratase [Rhodoferax sp. AJA081-3]
MEWISGWRAKEIPTNSERILGIHGASPTDYAHLLYTTAQSRSVEANAAKLLPPHMLMQRAGLAVAQFAMAIAPHAKAIWIPCGPGNNGGDGYEAAIHLKSWGKSPVVTGMDSPDHAPIDAKAARQRAIDTGVAFADVAPQQYDLCIDALFGIGRIRPWNHLCTAWIQRMNTGPAPVLAVDLPSGLDADTGATPALHVKANYTLSLLTLKPGLFTADGREASGDIWFNSLGVTPHAHAGARLTRRPPYPRRAHNTHKGSFGDLCVVGGMSGMTGAALLAARSALMGGAGLVYVSMLDAGTMRLDPTHPELMFRGLSEMNLASMTVVAGCGGGDAIHACMPQLLEQSARLVLDADALNVIAKDTGLQHALRARRAHTTVLTPHPLEAARLMKTSTTEVQANRLGVAQAMADRFACVVVLKGSGTVIAAPGVLPHINPTGNGRLATAGTGDVLAGLIGARLTANADVFISAYDAVYQHGQVADEWRSDTTMTAQDLARAL